MYCIIGTIAATPAMSSTARRTEQASEITSLRRVGWSMSSPVPAGKPIALAAAGNSLVEKTVTSQRTCQSAGTDARTGPDRSQYSPA